MSHFEQAFLIDARHLLDVDPRVRTPELLCERVEVLAGQMLLGGHASHRIVFADFADPAVRTIAEDIGARAGFRMRHVAATDLADLPALMVAEALEARAVNPQLRLTSFVTALSGLRSFADALHRSNLLVVVLTSEVSSARAAVDEVLPLPLDPVALQDHVVDAVVELKEEGTPRIASTELNRKLTGRLPGFRPSQYGFRNMQQLIGYMARRCLRVDAAGGIDLAVSARPRTPSGDTATARTRSSPTAVSRLETLCGDLAPREAPDLVALGEALSEVLALALADGEVSRSAREDGLPLVSVVRRCLQIVVPSYSKAATGVTLQDVCLFAVAGTAWSIGRREDMTSDVRIFLDVLPDGYLRVQRRASGGSDPTHADALSG